ncbi:hypothetical protein, no similarity [Maudiozyma barnettii]|uniref:Uncharacterized protein n=1 Tax=Maudiozyma barnettii TaxID=61262 RepID=A0A8H2VJF3_9SACH|nr:hypothetical protein, no similarity [Kazachstania barnettii]CAB4256542.1 hypothetical protein, no similarity [Kazachstania barnettii]CAD1785145.1 hypothetical protein, no similarity [Kazachstania barnettii]
MSAREKGRKFFTFFFVDVFLFVVPCRISSLISERQRERSCEAASERGTEREKGPQRRKKKRGAGGSMLVRCDCFFMERAVLCCGAVCGWVVTRQIAEGMSLCTVFVPCDMKMCTGGPRMCPREKYLAAHPHQIYKARRFKGSRLTQYHDRIHL